MFCHSRRVAALASSLSRRLLEDAPDCLCVPSPPDGLIPFLFQFSADCTKRVPLCVEIPYQRDGSLLCRILHEGLRIVCQRPTVWDLAGTLMFDYLKHQGILSAFGYGIPFPLGHARHY